MVALFLFLKGMTGALAPFSYLVSYSVTMHKAGKTCKGQTFWLNGPIHKL